MKKAAIAGLILGIVATVPAQGPASATATKGVTVTINPYVYVKFTTSAALVFNITDGGQSGSYTKTAEFTVKSNVNYSVTSTVTPPVSTGNVTAPGAFAVSTTLDGIIQPATPAQIGTLTLILSGLDLGNATKGSYTLGGKVTITVVDAS